MRFERLLGPVLAAVTAAGVSVAGAAADPLQDRLLVEFNKMEPSGSGCRMTWLLSNETGTDLQSLKLDLIAFDPDGVVARRVGPELGPIRQGHTRVKLFDLKSLECGDVSRMLMNGVIACVANDGTAGECAERLQTATRTRVPFSQ